jgi:beta-aspartyl-peptidase (threonine type)
VARGQRRSRRRQAVATAKAAGVFARRAVSLLLIPILTAAAGCGKPGQEEGAAEAESPNEVALVIHGGAGTIRRDAMSSELEAEYRATLAAALETGHALLAAGGSSLDAVEATIRLLEDSPLFNAGKGAVFTADGRNELDASIMDGATRGAGAVAAVTTLKNPISAARAVMEASPHVLLAGPGAEAFARTQGLEEVPPSYFFTERRWRQLEKKRLEVAADGTAQEHGTVGAVALDRAGRIAAGTSTGGMTYKRHGRIGDSPLVGAGTWADGSCGVSATGHGEFFIRWAVAHDICARARYQGLTVAAAAEDVVMRVLVEAGGSGGVIALDSSGRPTMTFNSEGMYRGYVLADGRPQTAIYGSEDDPQ